MRSSTQYTKGRDPGALFPRRRYLNSALRRLRVESAPGLRSRIMQGRHESAVGLQMRPPAVADRARTKGQSSKGLPIFVCNLMILRNHRR